jgi:hypothetical protein
VDDLLGTEVGNYRLIRVLGEGGMGRVYVGEQAAIASRVAIKVLTARDPELVGRFFAEARAVNVIKHPGLVKVQALSYLPDGRPYIIMELVEGETLRALVERDSPLAVGGVVDAMKQLLGALAAAHAHGVVHRDLKPDNVMLTPDGLVKVLDFGIAKLSPALGGNTPRTRTGAQIGTPAYMAPEQIRGEEVDARTDIYTAGVVMFEALTGRLPFEAATEFEMMRGHLERPAPRLSSVRAGLPPALDAIIDQTLAKRPEERFQTANALLGALASVQVPAERLIARPAVSMKLQAAAIAATVDASPPTVDGRQPTPDGHHSTVDERPPTAAPTRRASPGPRMALLPERVPTQQAPDALHRVTVERPRPSDRAIADASAAGPGPASRRWLAIPAVIVVGGAIIAAFALGRRGTTIERGQGGGGSGMAMGSGSTAPGVVSGPGAQRTLPAIPGTTFGPAPGSVDGAPAGPFAVKQDNGHTRGTLLGMVDPATLDPLASIPRATELARQLLPGVVFVGFDIVKIDAAGHIDFAGDGYVSYRFVLPNLKEDPVDDCSVSLVISRIGWNGMSGNFFCANRSETLPRCDLKEVRARAIKQGAPEEALAQPHFERGKWSFQAHPRAPMFDVADDCNVSTSAHKRTPVPGVTSVPAPPAAHPVTTPPVVLTPDTRDPDRKTLRKPFDMDAQNFDPVAYIPKAQAFARELVPGVDLYLLSFAKVREDGTIDLMKTGVDAASYVFIAKSGECWHVAVLFVGGQVMASAMPDDDCEEKKTVRAPRCTLAEVYGRAPKPHKGIVMYSSYGWEVDTKPVPDDCK